MAKNKKRKNSKWLPPKNFGAFFLASSDDEFKEKHPIGYVFLVLLGAIALFLPMIIFTILCILQDINSAWMVLGFVGGFIFGIGLFNFVAIIIRQYLGHLLSIISFLLGSGLMVASWFLSK